MKAARSLGALVLAGLMVGGCAADQREPVAQTGPLSEAEVEGVLSGTTFRREMADGSTQRITFAQYGDATLELSTGEQSVGRWRSVDEGACVEWQSPDGVDEECYEVYQATPETLELRDPQGQLDSTLTPMP